MYNGSLPASSWVQIHCGAAPPPTWIYPNKSKLSDHHDHHDYHRDHHGHHDHISAISLTTCTHSNLSFARNYEEHWMQRLMQCMLCILHKSLFRNFDFNRGLYSGLINDMTFWKGKKYIVKLSKRRQNSGWEEAQQKRTTRKSGWMIRSSPIRRTTGKIGW